MNRVSMEQYLTQVSIPLRLSCITPAGWPVVLSLWYLYEDGDLFCATTEKARVVTYLKANRRCAFEIAADQPPYCGLRGRASATIVPERGIEILERLLDRYLGGTDNKLARILLARSEAEVAIRLSPLTYHTWNFNQRMADLIPEGVKKYCPE